MIPQIILVSIYAMALGVAIVRHGTPKEGTNSVWSSIISISIVLTLLYWGGFFDVIITHHTK